MAKPDLTMNIDHRTYELCARYYSMSDFDDQFGLKRARISKELAAIPRSEEKARAHHYALAMHSDLSFFDASTYEAIVYWYRKGMLSSDRIQHAKEKFINELKGYSNLLDFSDYETIERQYEKGQITSKRKRQLLDELHTRLHLLGGSGPWPGSGGLSEADTAFFDFWQSVLPDEFTNLRDRFIRLQHEPLGAVLEDIGSGFIIGLSLSGCAMRLWHVLRVPNLAKWFYDICWVSLNQLPPSENDGFWNFEAKVAGKHVKLPDVTVSAQLAWSILQISSTRWREASRVAQWLRQKQRKDGSWDELVFQTQTQGKKLYGDSTELLKARLLPTCVCAQIVKKCLLDLDGSIADRIRGWLISHQDVFGCWNFPVSGVCEPETLVLETLDLLRLPIEQAFSLPLAHRLEKCTLTELPIKDYWNRVRDGLASLINGSNVNLTLAFIDLGQFGKRVNTISHHMGDTVITEFANALSRHFGKISNLVRWGGDEFVVIFNPGIAKPKVIQSFWNFDKVWIDWALPEEVTWERRPFVRAGIAGYPDDVSDPGEQLETRAEDRLRTLKGEVPPDESKSKLLICSD